MQISKGLYCTSIQDIPIEELQDVFRYEPKTGKLYWKYKTTKRRPDGLAGTLKSDSQMRYSLVWYRGRYYPTHAVIWTLMTGKYPTQEIDHINLDGFDNRWENLRAATRYQNNFNRKIISKNSEYKGVCRRNNSKSDRHWRAAIQNKEIGVFICAEEAALIYDSYARNKFGAYAYLNFPEVTDEMLPEYLKYKYCKDHGINSAKGELDEHSGNDIVDDSEVV